MRFIGSVVWDWEGKTAYKIRNKLVVYVAPGQNFLAKHRDPRYFEFFQDFSGQIWVRRPTGKQELLEKPYTIITRVPHGAPGEHILASKEIT